MSMDLRIICFLVDARLLRGRFFVLPLRALGIAACPVLVGMGVCGMLVKVLSVALGQLGRVS